MTEYEKFAPRKIKFLRSRRDNLLADLARTADGSAAEKRVAAEVKKVEIDIGLTQGRLGETYA